MKNLNDLQDDFYADVATLIVADIEDPIGSYALICTAIRYRLAGLSTEFIEESIDELTMADNIEFNGWENDNSN